MAYRLRAKENLVAGIPRICREQIDHGLTAINNKSLDRPEAVHEVRE